MIPTLMGLWFPASSAVVALPAVKEPRLTAVLDGAPPTARVDVPAWPASGPPELPLPMLLAGIGAPRPVSTGVVPSGAIDPGAVETVVPHAARATASRPTDSSRSSRDTSVMATLPHR